MLLRRLIEPRPGRNEATASEISDEDIVTNARRYYLLIVIQEFGGAVVAYGCCTISTVVDLFWETIGLPVYILRIVYGVHPLVLLMNMSSKEKVGVSFDSISEFHGRCSFHPRG